MKVCIIGDGLVSLTLANVLIQKQISIEIIALESSIWDDQKWSGYIREVPKFIDKDFTLKTTTTFKNPILGLGLRDNQDKINKLLDLLIENDINDLDSIKITDYGFWIYLVSADAKSIKVIPESIKFDSDIWGWEELKKEREECCKILTDKETDLWDYADVYEYQMNLQKDSIKKIIVIINNDRIELNV